MIKIILQTPFKGAQTKVSCTGANINSVQECIKQYVHSRGLAVSYAMPIPCKIEYNFDMKGTNLQNFNVLEYED